MPRWTDEWDGPRALLAALATATVIALIVVSSTSAIAFGAFNPAWDGAADLDDVARVAGSEVTVVRDVAAYDTVDPADTVAVVLAPAEPYAPAEARALRRFVERGGTLVVADDFGAPANPLLAALGARSRLLATPLRDEREFYRSPALPVATPVGGHPLVVGVDQVTLNHPAAVAPNGAAVLVSTSEYAYTDVNRNGVLDDAEPVASAPVITVESVGEGSLVVAGDPSLFINVMLDRPGNRAFVTNLFAGSERVLLDYSHAGGIPPLALAVLELRDSAWLSAAVGLVGLGVIVGWARAGRRWRRHLGSADRELTNGASPTTDELVAFLRRQHPDWDDDRLRRVVGGLMSSRGQSRPDE